VSPKSLKFLYFLPVVLPELTEFLNGSPSASTKLDFAVESGALNVPSLTSAPEPALALSLLPLPGKVLPRKRPTKLI